MKIAVIGGGISGISTALILEPHHEVHLFESENRWGGHAQTVTVETSEGSVPVDTGFLVYNTLTYPHFTRFLDYLGVATVDSDMSLSIQTPQGIEWAGTTLATVFAQKKNILNPSFLKMLWDILRFHKEAEENLELSRKNRWSLKELVEYRKVSKSFLSWYLLPMTGAIWSMSYAKALQFPAETFLNFCINHRLLQVNERPTWRTIDGGSIQYVNRAVAKLKNKHLGTPIESLRREEGKTVVRAHGQDMHFDAVVLATHAPVARALLAQGLPQLASLLQDLKTSRNQVILHQDSREMPKNEVCWSSWNVKARQSVEDQSDIALTYYLNKLQPLKTAEKFFITLNPNTPCEAEKRSFVYDHPQFDLKAIEFQKNLASIQGRDGIYFAGAWTRYGFHEDGILSAVNVGKILGCEPPWM